MSNEAAEALVMAKEARRLAEEAMARADAAFLNAESAHERITAQEQELVVLKEMAREQREANMKILAILERDAS